MLTNMLEFPEPKPDEKILDVGAGSGWVSALLAQIIGEKGKVLAMERIPELCEFGRQNVSKYNFIEKGTVEFICADVSRGYNKEALTVLWFWIKLVKMNLSRKSFLVLVSCLWSKSKRKKNGDFCIKPFVFI